MKTGARLLAQLREQLSAGFLIGYYEFRNGKHCFGLPALEFNNYLICIPDCDEVKNFVESEDFNRYQMQPKKFGVIFLDLVGFSDYDDETQFKIIVRYQCEVKRIIGQMKIEKCISIGDGTIFIIEDKNIGLIPKYANDIYCSLQDYNAQFLKESGTRIRCRIGVHVGYAYVYYDINKQINYVGSGINIAQRVCSCVPSPDDNTIREEEKSPIYVSKAAYEQFVERGLSKKFEFKDLGERKIKRGSLHVYALYPNSQGCFSFNEARMA